jgi:hypothetical protein
MRKKFWVIESSTGLPYSWLDGSPKEASLALRALQRDIFAMGHTEQITLRQIGRSEYDRLVERCSVGGVLIFDPEEKDVS